MGHQVALEGAFAALALACTPEAARLRAAPENGQVAGLDMIGSSKSLKGDNEREYGNRRAINPINYKNLVDSKKLSPGPTLVPALTPA